MKRIDKQLAAPPTPDMSNPEPLAHDVWFNYRSLQEVNVLEISESHAVVCGALSGKRTRVKRKDFEVTRWFKFLRHVEPASEPAMNEPSPTETFKWAIEMLISGYGQHRNSVLEELRTLNANVVALIELWKAPPKDASGSGK